MFILKGFKGYFSLELFSSGLVSDQTQKNLKETIAEEEFNCKGGFTYHYFNLFFLIFFY